MRAVAVVLAAAAAAIVAVRFGNHAVGGDIRIVTERDAALLSSAVAAAAGAAGSRMEGAALPWTGASVWESGEVLAQVLPSLRHLIEGKRVLELGAGCGLVGLTAASLGARETHVTDGVVHMAQFNLEHTLAGSGRLSAQAQSGLRRVRVSELSWGQSVEAFLPPLDLVLGADLLYKHDTHDALTDTISALCGQGTVVLLVTPAPESSPLLLRMRKYGFQITDISAEPACSIV